MDQPLQRGRRRPRRRVALPGSSDVRLRRTESEATTRKPGTRRRKPDGRNLFEGLAALVVQPSLDQLSGGFVHHSDLLVALVKITTYNEHCSAPFSEPWSV